MPIRRPGFRERTRRVETVVVWNRQAMIRCQRQLCLTPESVTHSGPRKRAVSTLSSPSNCPHVAPPDVPQTTAYSRLASDNSRTAIIHSDYEIPAVDVWPSSRFSGAPASKTIMNQQLVCDSSVISVVTPAFQTIVRPNQSIFRYPPGLHD